MRSREWKWYICFALVAAAAVGASIWTYVDMAGLCINIGSVVIMVSIIVCSIGCLNRKNGVGLMHLGAAAEQLRSASETIRELADGSDESVDDRLRVREEETPLFENRFLRQAYAAHRRELDRLYRDGSSFRFADIAEYVNQELLDHIGNMSFCDIVGGSMTGLGILGTFVGLMIGLQDFDPSTADSMMQTIPTLIDGIKIAFLTSIFGVVYSLLYNMYSRGVQEDAADALDGFLSSYYKYVIPQPENDGFTQLIRYQQSQTDSMAQFAEEISLTMANSLKANVAPTFQRIEESISKLTDRLAQSQSETMDEVASRFVESMDKTMGDQLTHLGENIQKLCTWQDQTMDKMEQTIRAFSEAGDKVGAISAKLDVSFGAMEQYTQSIAKLQQQVNTDFGKVIAAMDQAAEKLELHSVTAMESVEAQKDLVRSMNEMTASFCERSKAFQDSAIAAQKEMVSYSTAMQEGMNTATQSAIAAMNAAMQEELRQMQANMESIEKTQRAFIDGMDRSSEQLKHSAAQMSAASQDLTNNLDKAMSRTYQEIDHQMAEIVRHLSGTITEIRDVTEQLPKILASSAAQTQKTTEQYLATISESQKQLAQEVRRSNDSKSNRGGK